jgi:hypothetical protein
MDLALGTENEDDVSSLVVVVQAYDSYASVQLLQQWVAIQSTSCWTRECIGTYSRDLTKCCSQLYYDSAIRHRKEMS